ncbi:FecR family protein [Mucilaginibacter sp.]|uniref:FecR family protein n=1 Tax=Mucilaginibacter sp. TaxID=1882438 RepID=UPI0025DDFD73|nr:FecR family protein [Mucilaginibacter sp.]
MNITDELLDKYFKSQCTPEEQNAVNIFLSQIDEFPDHLLTQNEWDSVVEEDLSQIKSDQLFGKIKSKTFAKFPFTHWVRNIAAAAVIVMAVGLGYFALTTNNSKPNFTLNEKKQNAPSPVIQWKSTVNYANNYEKIVLPDGSEVKVYPGAEIYYAQPFIKEKREVFLNGKSYFHVTKDKKHPFVVYANGVSTTALGTSFTITATKGSSLVKVALHTGKVWVRNISSDRETPVFSSILKPGDVLTVNKLNNTLNISDSKRHAFEETALSINLVQVSLDKVFKKLEKHYGEKISFKDEDIKGKFFTGTLYLQTPLDTLLAEITELNKLTTIKSRKGYLIKK